METTQQIIDTNTPVLRADESYNLDLFFELSGDLLCIAGFDGYFKRINPAVSRLLGYSDEELLSKPINTFVHPDDRDITSRYRQNLTESVPLLNFENRYIKKSGETVWLSWTSIPVSDKQLVYAVAKDITHVKQIEQERNSHLTDLKETYSDLKQLTYKTSHDLRSPVNNLLSIFSLMDLSAIHDQETLDYINILKSTTEELKEMLNTSVDVLSKKEKSKLVIEEVNLEDVLNTVLRSVSSLVQTSGAVVHTDFSDFEKINFNRNYMESIFLNLLTNSIKYCRPGLVPQIKIATATVNNVHQLTFSDNGLGFDMKNAKNKIFGLNQKFHAHTDSKGVGLYLVYNHITSLGGQISVDSKINEGTTFRISFMD